MADIALIRKGIAANLAAIPNLQVSAYMLANPTPPAAHVVLGPAEYDRTFGRGMDHLTFTIQLFVGLVTDRGAQAQLEKYRAGSGANSVKAAVESDKTLGGNAFAARVTDVSADQQLLRPGGDPILMCEFNVEVYASGI